MYICSCNAVTDGQIKRAVHEDGVCTFRELMDKTKVCTQCKKCAKYAGAVFKEARREKQKKDAAES